MSSDARLPPRNSGMLRDVHERIAPLVGGVANDRRASNNAHRGNRLGGVATMFTTLAFSLMAVGLTLVVIGDALWGYFQAR